MLKQMFYNSGEKKTKCTFVEQYFMNFKSIVVKVNISGHNTKACVDLKAGIQIEI